MAHIGRIFAGEGGMLHAMRPAHQILELNPPCITAVCPFSSLGRSAETNLSSRCLLGGRKEVVNQKDEDPYPEDR